MQKLIQIIPWISLAISIYALYHSIKRDRLHGKIDKMHSRGELQKKLSKLRLTDLPHYQTLLSSSETKCKACPAYCRDDYDLIKEFLTQFKSSTDRLTDELRKPKILQNRLRIEETIVNIEIIEAFFGYLKENIKNRTACSMDMREANKANVADAKSRAADLR